MTGKPYFSHDISEFLAELAKHRVRYLIIGGEAVIYYGHARLTGDIGLLFDRTPENARRLFEVLQEFLGGAVPSVGGGDELLTRGTIFQFGVPPNRIDLLNEVEQVYFESAWDRKVEEKLEVAGASIPVYYIGLDDLILNKRAAGRSRDIDDLKFLEKAQDKLRRS